MYELKKRKLKDKYREVVLPCRDQSVETAKVGSYLANDLGLHDMLGNASEWVMDCETNRYHTTPRDGSSHLEDRSCINRVVRGSNWNTPAYFMDVYRRSEETEERRINSIGFRVARKFESEWTGRYLKIVTSTEKPRTLRDEPVTKNKAVKAQRDCAECPVMIRIPAGEFQMGYNESRSARPEHKVTIGKPYLVSKYEITVGQFRQFISATSHDATSDKKCRDADFGRRDSMKLDWQMPGFSQSDDHPVVCVSWNDVRTYVAWLSKKTGKPYRMLSEAEWEYAARAGTIERTPWRERNEACKFANLQDAGVYDAEKNKSSKRSNTFYFPCWDKSLETTRVGSYQSNEFGLHDMLGNVSEWVADCYDAGYWNAPRDGSAQLTGEECGLRRVRGSDWNGRPYAVGLHSRNAEPKKWRENSIGFRVARDADTD